MNTAIQTAWNQINRQFQEAASWLPNYFAHPRSIGSIMPSSTALAEAMTQAAQHHGAANSLIIEAGAGNGAITRVLADTFPLQRLTACENMADLAEELSQRLPQVCVRCCRVQDLPQWDDPAAKTIVSSLPFRSLPPQEAAEIAERLQHELHRNPASVLIQFTYGLRNPIPQLAQDPHIASFRHARVWRNLPPASVWVYRAHIV